MYQRIIPVQPGSMEMQADFEAKYPALIKKGLSFCGAMPLRGVADDAPIHPRTHTIDFFRPFIFDIRQLPKFFNGYELTYIINAETIPPQFRMDEDELLPFDLCWSEENIIAYAEDHASEIRAQLDAHTLTHEDICNMIAHGDFERHKEVCEEERVQRIMSSNDDDEDDWG